MRETKITEAQLVALRFAARICDSAAFGNEIDGVSPRRGQSQMFERLRLLGLLADAGYGVSEDDHEREVPIYVITDLGRSMLNAITLGGK